MNNLPVKTRQELELEKQSVLAQKRMNLITRITTDMHYQIVYAYTNNETSCHRTFDIAGLRDVIQPIIDNLKSVFPDFNIYSNLIENSRMISFVAEW
jgi:hypothetical protein